jgi:hypothetical protein
LLVPQGTRLIGNYDSQIAFGQSRVLLVWTRLIMPNERSIVLERQPGADTAGYAGLEDGVTITGVLYSRPLSFRRCLESEVSWDRVPTAATTVTSSRRYAAAP